MKIRIYRHDGEPPIPSDNIAFHQELKVGFDEIEKDLGLVELGNVNAHAERANALFVELQKKYPLFIEEEFTENTIKSLIEKYESPIGISFEKNRENGEEICIGLVLSRIPPGLNEELYKIQNTEKN